MALPPASPARPSQRRLFASIGAECTPTERERAAIEDAVRLAPEGLDHPGSSEPRTRAQRGGRASRR